MYATKRRRKNPKIVTNPLQGIGYKLEGGMGSAKSNPSKRHRERLNAELEHLASLLPFEQTVIAKLDKLSILRLAVSYLRMKGYFQALGHDHPIMEHRLVSHLYHCPIDITEVEGEASLHALNGFIFIVSCDGEVFSVCKTVEHYLGFHQSDILHQSVMELIHSEDREEFQRQLSWQAMLPGEHRNLTLQEVISPAYSHLLQRCFTVRFRCLLDNTSGFITLEISGRLQLLHGNSRGYPNSNNNNNNTLNSGATQCPTRGSAAQAGGSRTSGDPGTLHLGGYGASSMGLFGVCSPLGSLPSLDGSQREASFKTKHTLDLTITSMDSRAQTLFYFSGKENSKVKVYDLIHPDDLQYVAKGHSEVCETGSIGLLAHRWLSKNGNWIWLQSRLKVVYKNSKKDRIIAIHRKLDESEGNELYYRRNSEYKLPFPLLEPETLLSEDDVSDFCTGTAVESTNTAATTQQHSPDSSKASTYGEIKALYLDEIHETRNTTTQHDVTGPNRRKLWEGFPISSISASQKEACETTSRLTTPKIDTPGSTNHSTRNGGLGSGGNNHRRFRNQLKNYLQTTRRRKPQLKSATSNKAGRPVPPYGVRGTKQVGDADNGSSNSWYAYRNLLTRNPALGFFGVTRNSTRNPPTVQTADSRLSEYSLFHQNYASSCGYPSQLVRGYEAGQASSRVWDLETHGGSRRKREVDFDLSAAGVMSVMTGDQQALGYSAMHPQYNPLVHGMNGDYSSAYEAYSAAVAAAAVVAAASGQNQQEYGCNGSVGRSPDSETLQVERLYEGAARVIHSPNTTATYSGSGMEPVKETLLGQGYPLQQASLAPLSSKAELSVGAFTDYQSMITHHGQKPEGLEYRKLEAERELVSKLGIAGGGQFQSLRLSTASSSASATLSASVAAAVADQAIDAESEALRLFKVNGRPSQPWFSNLGSFASNSGHGENEQGLYSNFPASTSDSTPRDASCYFPELSNHNIYSDSLLPWSHFENRQTICIDDGSLCDTARYQLGFTATT
ncbi:hypothetical protein SprV_0301169200 [Sparganum proliferum]